MMLAGAPGPRVLAEFGAGVMDHAQRSLKLLNAIEEAIGALCLLREWFAGPAEYARQVAERIKSVKPERPIDPEGVIEAIFAQAQHEIKRLHLSLLDTRVALKDARDLTAEDGFVDELTLTIDTVTALLDALTALRWAIMEHDADLEEVVGPFDTVDELFASIRRR